MIDKSNLSTAGAFAAVAFSYTDVEQAIRIAALISSIAWTGYNFWSAIKKNKGKK